MRVIDMLDEDHIEALNMRQNLRLGSEKPTEPFRLIDDQFRCIFVERN